MKLEEISKLATETGTSKCYNHSKIICCEAYILEQI